MTPVLEVCGLAKSFGRVVAVRDADFTLPPGSVTALLGQNGAGKTTTLKAVLGFLRPDAGTILIRAGRVGYVPEEPAFFPWLSGRDILRATRLSAGQPSSDRCIRAAADAWSDRLGFEPDLLDRPARTLSHGNRKKLSYLQNLILEPDLLIADEPLSALDPGSIRRLRGLVAGLRAAGTTVLLSSHIIAEMEKMCDRVIVMHRGRVLLRDGLEALRAAGPGEGTGAAFDLERLFLSLTGGG